MTHTRYIVCFCLSLIYVLSEQCPVQTLMNRDEETKQGICKSDNCAVDVGGWDSFDKTTLNVLCPYAIVYCDVYGSDHTVYVNCYKCRIVDDCTLERRNNSLYYDDMLNTIQFNNSNNCECSAIHQCQMARTNEFCSDNSNLINIAWETDNENDQYIECQKRCFIGDAINCIYGIYYLYKNDYKSECRIITGGCNVYQYENDNGKYYFLSKGCMSFENGTFHATVFPYDSNVSLLDIWQITTIVFGAIIFIGFIAMICNLIRTNNKNYHLKKTYNKNNIENKFDIGSSIELPNGQIAIIQNDNDDNDAMYKYNVRFSILNISPNGNGSTMFNCLLNLTAFVLMNVLTDYGELFFYNLFIFWYIGLGGIVFAMYLMYKHYLYILRKLQLKGEHELNDEEEEIHCFEEDINCAIFSKYLIFIEIAIRIIVRIIALLQCILIPIDVFAVPFTIICRICCIPKDWDLFHDFGYMLKFPLMFDFIPKYKPQT